MHQRTLPFISSLAGLALMGFAGSVGPVAAQEAGADQAPPLEAAAPAAPRHHRVMHAAPRTASRPLTVSRRAAPPPFLEPSPARDFAGPAAIVVMPLQAASDIVDLPFRALGTVFPAAGDPAQNVLVIVGMPIHAVGQLAQVPFRMVEAPFRVDAPSLF